VSLSVCAALLISPYLQNYDFAFLLIPLLVVARRIAMPAERAFLVLAYTLPWVGFGLFGRIGNGALLVSTTILAAMLARLTAAVHARTILSTE
jgi:hypothetical protein